MSQIAYRAGDGLPHRRTRTGHGAERKARRHAIGNRHAGGILRAGIGRRQGQGDGIAVNISSLPGGVRHHGFVGAQIGARRDADDDLARPVVSLVRVAGLAVGGSDRSAVGNAAG